MLDSSVAADVHSCVQLKIGAHTDDIASKMKAPRSFKSKRKNRVKPLSDSTAPGLSYAEVSIDQPDIIQDPMYGRPFGKTPPVDR